MMIDDRKHVRELAAIRIKAAREKNGSSLCRFDDITKFTIHKLKSEAKDHEPVNWLDFPRHEPPI